MSTGYEKNFQDTKDAATAPPFIYVKGVLHLRSKTTGNLVNARKPRRVGSGTREAFKDEGAPAPRGDHRVHAHDAVGMIKAVRSLEEVVKVGYATLYASTAPHASTIQGRSPQCYGGYLPIGNGGNEFRSVSTLPVASA